MIDDNESPRLVYRDPGKWTREQVEQALRDNDPEILCRAVCGYCMYGDDWQFAQDLCVRLWAHSDVSVHGIILTGFAHIARVHGRLDREVVEPILKAAANDSDLWVRGNADDAMDDMRMYLRWHFDWKVQFPG